MLPMQKVFVILTLIHLVTCSIFINKKYNSTDNWSTVRHIQASVPIVVQVNNSLIHILDSNDPKHALEIKSTDFKTCKVALELAYLARYPRRAISLGNGKIVVWLLNYRFTPNQHFGEWIFVIVEPRNCTHHGFEIQDNDPTPIDVIDVVGYEDSFDVFITSLSHEELRNTYVYRYSDEGKSVSSVVYSVIPDLDSYPFYRPYTIRVHSIKPYNSAEGFFYLQLKPQTNTTIIKRLDANFDTIKSTSLNHFGSEGFGFGAYSTDHGNFSACNYNIETHNLHCLLLDKLLNEKARIVVNNDGPENGFMKMVYINVKNRPDGGALVVFAKRFNRRVDALIYAQRLNSSGRSLGEPTMLGKIKCEIDTIYIFEMNNGGYCFSVTCDEWVHTKCGDFK